MKVYPLIVITLFLTVLVVAMIGCEYNGPTAMYYQKHAQTTPPVITRLNPAEAAAGVNYITIIGANFSDVSGNNKVYFDGYQAEIVTNSTTAITVRRPNRAGDSITVKVVNSGALEIAKYRPYKIALVHSPYGGFVSGNQLSAIAVDKNENVYVIQTSPRTVYKIRPDGEKTIIGEALRVVTEAKVSPDGKLILMMNYRRVYKMDVETGIATEWIDVGTGKNVSFGDFDSNGNFYFGGKKSDLRVVTSGSSTSVGIGVYPTDEILGVRVYKDYVYVLVDIASPTESNPKLAIWRHQIQDANGSLGGKELVLNWANTSEYAASVPQTLTFSEDGLMYIGTNYTHPIMSFDLQTGRQDILYKGILPSSAVQLVWGTGNYLYMLLGGAKWNLIRIDMGAPGAPYYGR